MVTAIPAQALLAELPPEWPEDVLPDIRMRLGEARQIVVVLDDDPTGTQTVHDVPVLTEWSVESLRAELSVGQMPAAPRAAPAFYILTNSRALTPDAAAALNAEIGRNLRAASHALPNCNFAVISRSDSTLRGHFPAEVDALTDALLGAGQAAEGGARRDRPPYLLIPAFFAGGRYTVNDVHYVAYGDAWVPAGETEFARDAAFGYRASNLRAWVVEKSGGAIPAERVRSITLDDVRIGGPDRVADLLAGLPAGSVCVVNAVAERDLEVVALATLMVEAQGRRLIYRSAASFVRARAGIVLQPLLNSEALVGHTSAADGVPAGGLIVVGSYVPKTSEQLRLLLAQRVQAIEVRVAALLDDVQSGEEIQRVARQADALIAGGRDVVIYTSREWVGGRDAADSLRIGKRVSEALIGIVRELSCRPRYVLAKGGITSSDIATHGLGVRRAMVLGQVLPGVPVWRLGPESRYPGLLYVVFPGNVGGPTALADVYALLGQDARR